MIMTQKHPHKLLGFSYFPITIAFSLLGGVVGFIMYIHHCPLGLCFFYSSSLLFFNLIFFWWIQLIKESTFYGFHTKVIQLNIKIAMILFMCSEIMFFFSFFWAFFHSSLMPDFHIGGMWPPKYFPAVNAWEKISLYNTYFLLFSGTTLTWSHLGLLNKSKIEFSNGLLSTIFCGILFSLTQLHEYIFVYFTLTDGIYSSIFFITTLFHGSHVMIGTIFLIVCWLRGMSNHYTYSYINFEIAAWYWHFVDIVWIAVFLSIYWWGGN